jgi:ADP-ribose pyrophosphatase
LLLVEQYRPPVGCRVIELPAGLAGDIAGQEHEDLSVAAIRELEEETGWSTTTMTRVAGGPVSAGLTSEVVTFFRAGPMTRTGAGGGHEGEDIFVHAVPRTEVPAWLRAREAAGMMVDPKVWTALLFAATNDVAGA